MAGFLRRFTFVPPLEVIRQIEGVVIIDLAPPEPTTGAGTGTVLVVGEFDDGFFTTDEDGAGGVEVFGSADLRQKFGGFGYTYSGVPSSNPCSRRHLLEDWNGNGFIKLCGLRAQRLIVARVDTSVGSVSFDPLACLLGGTGPFVVTSGGTLSVTTQAGTAASDAITGAAATVAGALEAFATIVSGDSFGIRVDGGQQVTVTFGAADTTVAAVVARINAAVGYAAGSDNAGELDLVGILQGTAGSIQLIETTPGVLAKLGHSAGTTAGTGNVANVSSVTVAEVVSVVNGSAALGPLGVTADISDTGALRICNSSPASTATLEIASGTLATELSITDVDTEVTPTDHPGGQIKAGTRVRTAGADEWVTMQTLDIPEGEAGPFVAKVRPALDDGTAAGTGASTITTIVDPSDVGALTVSNAQALTAALTENQLDNAYIAAMDTTLDLAKVSKDANYLLLARRSDALVRAGRANAIKATECGARGRKFVTGDPLGATVSEAVANVANFRSDRVFYTSKGLRVRIPEIAARGTAGGIGFTADGVITVRPDGPLTTICATRPPEENPGQETRLIEDFFAVNAFGETLDVEAYKAYRAAGIAVPRLDDVAGMVFQSGVTSSLEDGRKNIARRKMADFIQDSIADISAPFVKKLSSEARRDRLRGKIEEFLAQLESAGARENARIDSFSVDDGVNAGNTPASLALGVYRIVERVRTLASLDFIVNETEIGENAVTNVDA